MFPTLSSSLRCKDVYSYFCWPPEPRTTMGQENWMMRNWTPVFYRLWEGEFESRRLRQTDSSQGEEIRGFSGQRDLTGSRVSLAHFRFSPPSVPVTTIPKLQSPPVKNGHGIKRATTPVLLFSFPSTSFFPLPSHDLIWIYRQNEMFHIQKRGDMMIESQDKAERKSPWSPDCVQA